MNERRDICWLKGLRKHGLISYQMEGNISKDYEETLQEELPALFESIRCAEEGEKASLTLMLVQEEALGEEGYRIEKNVLGYQLYATSAKGWLYGIYGLHRILCSGVVVKYPYISVPDQCIRMLNHWDNVDGSIERGYAGRSIFFEANHLRGDYKLLREYARLLASVGINAISINNVNVHEKETYFIKRDFLGEAKPVFDIFGRYGIKVFLSVNFAAPMSIDGFSTADPLDQRVQNWWKNTAKEIYELIPDFGGFVVKADSEGRPGPFSYHRTHADGANLLARALAPYGGVVIWRCFVYNCAQKWWQKDVDRAKAAYEIFKELDGQFEQNVILQIKNGPIDFQIREPVSPLFGSLERTNQILEFQITQEYTGQQRDLCYLVPLWKEVLDFDTRHGGFSVVKEILPKKSPIRKLSGIAAVDSVGMDRNWTGHKLAQANLYGFGRLCWDNELSSEEIAKEWTASTFELPPEDEAKVLRMLLTSRQVYENYTCSLGVGFWCKRATHYGVDVDGYEYDRWGTYHYADRQGIGRDRTVATGTGYVAQYSEERCREYDDPAICPDELLLFFHHVDYSHVLHSGKTVLQHIYDTHFQGVEQVREYQELWESLRGKLSDEDFENVKTRLEWQLDNAIEWQNVVNTYFYRKTGIPDEKGRKIYP